MATKYNNLVSASWMRSTQTSVSRLEPPDPSTSRTASRKTFNYSNVLLRTCSLQPRQERTAPLSISVAANELLSPCLENSSLNLCSEISQDWVLHTSSMCNWRDEVMLLAYSPISASFSSASILYCWHFWSSAQKLRWQEWLIDLLIIEMTTQDNFKNLKRLKTINTLIL